MYKRYPRDMYGYGAHPPQADWPNNAKLAIQFVINYEEGGENCLLHDDTQSEAFLSEIVGAEPFDQKRHWNMESIYEYGARAGFWRLHRLFTAYEIPVTIYGVATALARSPVQTHAMIEAGWEIASHGYKWIDYKDFSEKDEIDHIEKAIALHEQVTGETPQGWYTGRTSERTVDLITKRGGFAYIADSYADDLPYWHVCAGTPQLIIPYTLDVNDMRFAAIQGFNSGEQFFHYLKDSFDALYEEGIDGQEGNPKMLSVGLHCRLIGRPGRIQALKRFIDYVKMHDAVWYARRIDIARHWHEKHPFDRRAYDARPSRLEKEPFVARFKDVFESSAWVAEDAFALELGPAHDTPIGLWHAMCRAFRQAGHEKRENVLLAHPDLAGKLAEAKQLTAHSTDEQASAGLDRLTQTEKQNFMDLNTQYKTKFGFPFILAVKGLNKAEILAAFQQRLTHDKQTEFETACQQVEKIAFLRLSDML